MEELQPDGTKLPTSTSHAPLLNSEKRVLMSHGWAPSVVLVFWVVSPTMMPVTNSGVRAVRQRRKTVSQLYHTFSCSKGIAAWAPWPASKDARSVKVAVPS